MNKVGAMRNQTRVWVKLDELSDDELRAARLVNYWRMRSLELESQMLWDETERRVQARTCARVDAGRPDAERELEYMLAVGTDLG